MKFDTAASTVPAATANKQQKEKERRWISSLIGSSTAPRTSRPGSAATSVARRWWSTPSSWRSSPSCASLPSPSSATAPPSGSAPSVPPSATPDPPNGPIRPKRRRPPAETGLPPAAFVAPGGRLQFLFELLADGEEPRQAGDLEHSPDAGIRR